MSLYKNINKRKKAGTSSSKKDSTITPKAYANMKAGFPKKKKKKAYAGGGGTKKSITSMRMAYGHGGEVMPKAKPC